MSKRILMFGVMAMILAAAAVAILTVLDVIELQDAREALGETTLVIAIVTAAVVLLAVAARLGKRV